MDFRTSSSQNESELSKIVVGDLPLLLSRCCPIRSVKCGRWKLIEKGFNLVSPERKTELRLGSQSCVI